MLNEEINNNENPNLFISYSWTSPDHEEWVLNLAEELVNAGVDVILDKWNLREGNDAYAFMEKMVTDDKIDKVILVCDKEYAEKADDRSGGVGTETQIISQEIYEKEDQNKFVAVVKEKNEEGAAYLPTYYKSRIYIDLSSEEVYAEGFEKLLRWIYDEPLHKKPELGEKPAFLDDDSISIGTSYKFKRAINGIKKGKNFVNGALTEYFNTLSGGLEKFRIEYEDKNKFDEKLIENINSFIPYRNEAIEIFIAIGQYKNIQGIEIILHDFFESLISYLSKPKEVRLYREWDFDNFKFIVQELFLYCISSLIKHEYFKVVFHLLNKRYYIEDPQVNGMESMQSFNIFNNHLPSLKYRNDRLNLRRLSLHGDLLKERCKGTGIKFNDVMQADFILYLRDSLDATKSDKEFIYRKWYPHTLVFNRHQRNSFVLFARAESKHYFNKIKNIFNINQPKDFEPLFKAFEEGKIKLPSWGFRTLSSIRKLMSYDKLATRE